tara:strand:+ start:1407 stop:1766 length:360 start_codon:yes stop_codon:yes gene_type:complete
MRFHEFKESRTDEIAPLALGLLRGVTTIGGGVAKAAKGMGSAVKKAGKAALTQAGMAAADAALQKGKKVKLAPNAEVQIDKVQGDEITLSDPKNKQAPKTVISKKGPEAQNLLKKSLAK